MFAGHIGAALAIGRFERRVNVGAFVIAALLLDLLLWIFVLLGLESVTISADFAATHHLEFIFPYSHGFLMSIAWSVLAAAAAVLWYPPLKEARFRAAMLIAAAVFSHWVLDALVHVPELPLAGEGSLKVGLGLWRAMAVALVVESLFVAIGLFLFLQGSSLLPARKIWLAGNSGALLHGGWDDDRTASTVGPSLGSQFTRHNYGGLRSLWVAQQAPK